MTTKKNKVLMYYAFENKIGGPLVYLRSIINSELNSEYEFLTLFQNVAAGGINIKLLRSMINRIKSEKPDIVHVHGLQSEGLYGVLAAKLAGCRCVVTTVHGFAFDGKKCGIKWFLYKYFVEPLTLRLSDKVYCVCRYASERSIVRKNTRNNNCGYIYNAVGELSTSLTRGQIRAQFGIADNETVFVISGRVAQDKGFDILTESVKQLNCFCSLSFRLLVVGDGEYLSTFCTDMCNEIKSGQVIIVGKTDRVADFLSAADVFVLPSYHENLPLALLEAGKMGLPCIASNVGGIPEVIEDGKTGFLIDNGQSNSYAQKMELLMTNTSLRYKMSRAIKKVIDERFSMSLMCKQIKEIYVDGIREKGLSDSEN